LTADVTFDEGNDGPNGEDCDEDEDDGRDEGEPVYCRWKAISESALFGGNGSRAKSKGWRVVSVAIVSSCPYSRILGSAIA
jgi:hypothetical protein